MGVTSGAVLGLSAGALLLVLEPRAAGRRAEQEGGWQGGWQGGWPAGAGSLKKQKAAAGLR